jgi:hypothetical protein
METTGMLSVTPQKTQEGLIEALDESPLAPKPVMLGPTPQKDGMIMGLFDDIPNGMATPSKTYLIPGTPNSKRAPLQQIAGNTPVKVSSFKIPMTPSRSRPTTSPQTVAVEAATPKGNHITYDFEPNERQLLKTPMSSGKKFMLAQFLTPPARRKSLKSSVVNESLSQRTSMSSSNGENEHAKTPSSTAKKYATPACLKQYMEPKPHMETVNETEENILVGKAKRPTILRRTRSKPFVGYRALLKERDEIIAEQKRVEEEIQLEENEAIFREFEMEQDYGAASSVGVSAEVSLVPETQYEDMLAFAVALDDDGFFAEDLRAELKAADEVDRQKREEAGLAPQRVFKKKGLKRQTKRVKSKF